MTMYLRRRAQFSAAYSRPQDSGMGRGHDFVCELTIGGKIDPRTGMVVNIKDVDTALKAKVVGALHGKMLDTEVTAFYDRPPTLENLALFIYEECQSAFLPQAVLERVTLWQTPTLRAEILAAHELENPSMLTLTRAYDFSASHRLHSAALTDAENAELFGKCNWANGHGHNYDVEVTLAGESDQATGQLAPLEKLDAIVEEVVLKPYDHKHLNFDTVDFRDLNPTSENLTKVIWDNLSRRLEEEPLGNAQLYKVVVRETARNYFEYYGNGTLGSR